MNKHIGHALGGLCGLALASASSMPMILPIRTSYTQLILPNFTNIEVAFDSASWDFTPKKDANGEIFNQKIAFRLLQTRNAMLDFIEANIGQKLIAKIKTRQGQELIIGTKATPLFLKASHNSGSEPKDNDEYSFELTGETYQTAIRFGILPPPQADFDAEHFDDKDFYAG